MIREFHQISLRTRNSFGVDQQAARLVEFETPEDLRTLFAAGIPEKWTVLAGGNNILFTRDYDGVLLTPVARGITLLSDDGDEVRVRADAGVEWDDLVEWAVGRGLWGIENLSLIPGKAGAAPVQNIGAYGCEAKDAIRRAKLPDPAVLGNAGSFFKNPVVGAAAAERLLAEYPDMPHYPAPEGRVKLAAGWLIDRAGMKGRRKGAVGVHERQALVLVNHGGATGGEVIAFAHEVQERVREKFGIEIDTEVNIL